MSPLDRIALKIYPHGLVGTKDVPPPRLVLGVMLVLGLSLGAVLFALARFISTHWDEALTTDLAIKLLVFWIILNLILVLNRQGGFHFFWMLIKLDSRFHSSVGFKFVMALLTTGINSSFWFALLRLFRTIETIHNNQRVKVNVFAFCFISSSLIFVDG